MQLNPSEISELIKSRIQGIGAGADTLDPALDQLADFRRVELHVSS